MRLRRECTKQEAATGKESKLPKSEEDKRDSRSPLRGRSTGAPDNAEKIMSRYRSVLS